MISNFFQYPSCKWKILRVTCCGPCQAGGRVVRMRCEALHPGLSEAFGASGLLTIRGTWKGEACQCKQMRARSGQSVFLAKCEKIKKYKKRKSEVGDLPMGGFGAQSPGFRPGVSACALRGAPAGRWAHAHAGNSQTEREAWRCVCARVCVNTCVCMFICVCERVRAHVCTCGHGCVCTSV